MAYFNKRDALIKILCFTAVYLITNIDLFLKDALVLVGTALHKFSSKLKGYVFMLFLKYLPKANVEEYLCND
ncbi:hypothetical protein A9Q81_06210 [Gammaproteobacteria bacterium 42_54_T18]|nr:hypothetical protein A9Q81_06210 [Gammaproteobacteria bacterium 42_54_T18]